MDDHDKPDDTRTQTLPYVPQYPRHVGVNAEFKHPEEEATDPAEGSDSAVYGHHGTGMASHSAQWASLPPVTGPAGSGHPGREGTGMGSLHWEMADPNTAQSSEIVAVILEDTSVLVPPVIDAVSSDGASEAPMETAEPAMNEAEVPNEDHVDHTEDAPHEEHHEDWHHPE